MYIKKLVLFEMYMKKLISFEMYIKKTDIIWDAY